MLKKLAFVLLALMIVVPSCYAATFKTPKITYIKTKIIHNSPYKNMNCEVGCSKVSGAKWYQFEFSGLKKHKGVPTYNTTYMMKTKWIKIQPPISNGKVRVRAVKKGFIFKKYSKWSSWYKVNKPLS